MGILNDLQVMAVKIEDCGEALVTLTEADFALEPMYFNWGYNKNSKIELRKGVFERLRTAKKILRSRPGCENWDFKIWDGFRTLKTQKILYDSYYDELKLKHPDWGEAKLNEAVQIFVSRASRDPALPPPHNTGGAVDLTIIDGAGKELDMGTSFDEFNVRSYTKHFKNGDDPIEASIDLAENNLPAHSPYACQRFNKNRTFFMEIMSQAGFVNYPEEWWHFSYGDQAWAAEKGQYVAIYGSMEL